MKKTLIIFLIFLFTSVGVNAQNERFYGGRGDGADVSTGGIINFNSIDYEGDVFTVHIDKATGQSDTTENDVVNFKLTFSEPVIDLRQESIVLSGDAQAQIVEITGGGTEYNVAVSGMLSNGLVIINIPAGNVHNSVGAPNMPAIIVDNDVVYLGADLTVEILRAAGQSYLTNNDTVCFEANFNEEVVDFSVSDIWLFGTSQPQGISISGSNKNYIIKVYDFQSDGNVSVEIPAGVVSSVYGKMNLASTNTQNTVVIDKKPPDVEIKLADGQTNPAYTYPIKFKVVFSEDVVDFSALSLMYGGSDNIKITVSGNGSVYIVAVDSVATNETVSIYLAEDEVHDFAGNGNSQPLYTENSVTFKGVTGLENIQFNDFVKIFSTHEKLNLVFKQIPVQGADLEIYLISGKKIIREKVFERFYSIQLPIQQIYIVNVYFQNMSFYQKLYIP